MGMAAKVFRQPHRSGTTANGGSSSRDKIDRSKLTCSHCGMSKHTKDECFQLVGYPEWWENNHKPPKGSRRSATAAMVVSEVNAAESNGGDGGMHSNRKEERGEMARAAAMESKKGKKGDEGSCCSKLEYEGNGLR